MAGGSLVYSAAVLFAVLFTISSSLPVVRDPEAQLVYPIDYLLRRQPQQNAKAERFNWKGVIRDVLPHVIDSFDDDDNNGDFDWKGLARNALPHVIDAIGENPEEKARAQIALAPFLVPLIAPVVTKVLDEIFDDEDLAARLESIPVEANARAFARKTGDVNNDEAKEQLFSTLLPYIAPIVLDKIIGGEEAMEQRAPSLPMSYQLSDSFLKDILRNYNAVLKKEESPAAEMPVNIKN